jgi:serine/threonine-protein kinase
MPEILSRLRAALAESYQVDRVLGRGGTATVFLAQDLRHHRPVAIKVLDPEIAGLLGPERFLREIEIASRLQHPNILTVLDSGAADGMLYSVMPYVEGESLRERLNREQQLSVEEALRLTSEVADALDSAHRHGIVHRDIKPENILLSEGHAVVTDFGIARAVQGATGKKTTTSGTMIGTPTYMSPEQAAGNVAVDGRSDTYSLGCVLFEMLAGQPPFGGPIESVVHQQLSVEPRLVTTLRPAVPEPVARVLARSLAKTPADRYRATGEFSKALAAAARGRPARARAPTWSRSALTAVPALAIATALVVLGVRWIGVRWIGSYRAPAHSLVVLPFTNVTGEPGLDYVCDGVAAEVLAELVQMSRLNVVSRTSAWSMRETRKEATAIARELGVRNIVEGTVQRRAGGLRLDVQLVDGRNGYVLWSGEFQRSLDDLPRLAGDISVQLAARLEGRPASAPAAAIPSPTGSVAAYDYYLQAGRFLDSPDDPQGPTQAVALYSRAIALDGEFALAHAGLSKALWKEYRTSKDPETLRRAEAAADRAFQLRPELLEARLARAQMYRAVGRYAESISELGKILDANPNWDEAHLHLYASYRDAGDMVRAEESVRRALALRPGYWNNWNSLGALLVKKGDYAGARRAFEQIVKLIPEANRGYEQLALVATLENKHDDAIAAYDRLPLQVVDGKLASNIGIAYFFARRLSEAEKYFRLAARLDPRIANRRQNLGDLYLRRGDAGQAQNEYRQGLKLVEEQLALEPVNRDLAVQRVLLLAKTGSCGRAEQDLETLRATLPAKDAQIAHTIARVHALCGRSAAALEALRTAIALGFSARMIREEDEFRALARLREFQRLTHAPPAGG